MKHAKEIEELFKDSLESLPIFLLPRNQAIIYLLRIMDDYARLPIIAKMAKDENLDDAVQDGHFNARRAMDALSVLMPLIDEKNHKSKKFNISRYKENSYAKAGNAVEIAEISSWIKDVLKLVYERIYSIKKWGKSYYFVPKSNKIRQDANSQVINLREPMHLAEDLYKTSNTDKLGMVMMSHDLTGMIKVNKDGSMTYSMPDEVFSVFKELFDNIFEKIWTLDETIDFGKYSIKEAKEILSALDAIAGFQQIMTLKSGLPGIGMELLPIVVRKKYICEFISEKQKISLPAVTCFLEDLIFNKKFKTNEIMFQPIIESDDGECLFISPSIILLSNPERNMMKLWARLYPGKYGEKIAKKGRKEEEKISNTLKQVFNDVIVATGKELHFNGQVLTDVDIGVYDKKDGCIFIIQHKWIMQPDSTKEMRNSDDALNEGMIQLDKVIEYKNKNPEWAEDIFNEKNLKVTKVFYCVLSTSNTGSFWVLPKYKVFNQKIFLRLLNENKFKSIEDFFNALVKAHYFESYIDYINVYDGKEFKGCKFYAPGTALAEGRKLVRSVKHKIFGQLFRDTSLLWPKQLSPLLFKVN